MTKKTLVKLLEKYPDDMIIVVDHYHEGFNNLTKGVIVPIKRSTEMHTGDFVFGDKKSRKALRLTN